MFILGDFHGKYNEFKKLISDYDLTNDSIFCVGDFGVGFNPKTEYDDYISLNEFLINRNLFLYTIRGNHDFERYFIESLQLYNFSNLKFLEDYSTMEIEGKKLLFIGGASSIDKTYRLQNNLPWDENETVVENEDFQIGDDIDIVITHTAPSFCKPINTMEFYDSIVDADLKYKMKRERMYLSELYENRKGNIKYWFYGHFHRDNVDFINETSFRCLNELSLYEIR